MDDNSVLREMIAREIETKMLEAMMGGPPRKPRQTALRVRGRSFDAVNLDDAGNVIEPIRCTCGSVIMHWLGCPFYGIIT